MADTGYVILDKGSTGFKPKADWKCHLCQYCSVECRVIFKGPKETFKLSCSDCYAMMIKGDVAYSRALTGADKIVYLSLDEAVKKGLFPEK